MSYGSIPNELSNLQYILNINHTSIKYQISLNRPRNLITGSNLASTVPYFEGATV